MDRRDSKKRDGFLNSPLFNNPLAGLHKCKAIYKASMTTLFSRLACMNLLTRGHASGVFLSRYFSRKGTLDAHDRQVQFCTTATYTYLCLNSV